MMEAIRCSEMSAIRKAAQPNIPEDGILYAQNFQQSRSTLITLKDTA
jgi:hypothetical protein